MKIYKVGGAVRDKLLNLPVKDIDWVVIGSTPQELESLGYKPVGQNFPVFLHPETHEEYALARTERKTAPGYKGFVFNSSPAVTLEEDLKRRDLTINALAEDVDGNIIDLFCGIKDLNKGVLRHITSAFVEDPLRVLRVARFAARFKFSVAEETIETMRQISESGEIDALVPERVWMELESALSEEHASLFFSVLKDCNALKHVFPEIDNLYGVPQPEKYHPEIDSGIHTMMVLDQACAATNETDVRFAALVHDLGKATTPVHQLPSHRGHEQRSVELIETLCERYRVPNRYRDLAVVVARHHLDCHRINEMRPDTILKKLKAIDAFRRPERFEKFLIACKADALGRGNMGTHTYKQADIFHSYFQAAANIDTSSVAAEGLDGKKIAMKIEELRVNAIAKLIDSEN